MATNKKSFILYCDLIHTVSKLNDEQAGKLFKHILSYVNDENPVSEDLITNLAFEPVKQALKRDLVKYEKLCEKNKENIRKRWDTKKNEKIPNDTTVYERIRTDTKNTDNDNDNDNDIVVDVNSEINALFKLFENEIKSGAYDEQMNLLKLKFKIKYLSGAIEDFRTHLLVEGKVHPNTRELFKHFRNWLNMVDPKGVLNKYKL
jgi:hypothetical protein